jgi:S1-C subfamily serine protease
MGWSGRAPRRDHLWSMGLRNVALPARCTIARFGCAAVLAFSSIAGAVAASHRQDPSRMVASDPTRVLGASAAEARNQSGAALRVAQVLPTEEQQRRSEYVKRALQPPTIPTLAGRKERATGTGFFVSEHILLTNYHVVAKCAALTIGVGEDPVAVTIEAVDQQHDLAALKSDVAAKGAVPFEARLERTDGSDLSIVGFPEHGLVRRQADITPGVAKPGSLATRNPMFQVFGDFHPGQSGSPVLDEYGAVVGVLAKKVDTVATYQKTGVLVDNIGLAIPNQIASEFLKLHQLPYQLATPSQSQAPNQRLEGARAFVYQVSCWQ